MPRIPKVDHTRDAFLRAIESAEALNTTVMAGTAIRGRMPGRLHPEQATRVTELAFMSVVAAWETFLEDSTIRYMAGATCDSGHAPSLRLGRCKSLDHAYQVYAGTSDYNPSKDYIDWRSPKAVGDRARLYFEGGNPYAGVFTSYTDKILDANKIRDRIAHASSKASNQFMDVARRLRGAGLHQGYRVGDLLRSQCTQHFGHTKLSSGKTVFGAYMSIYRDAAKRIVP
jgi:hypothetical protein